MQAYQQTPAYKKALRKRRVWVDPLFAEGKQWHVMRRFRLRRLWRVNSEALLLASGQNLKRLLQQRGWGRRPFPSGAAMAADGLCARLLNNLSVTILVVGGSGDSSRTAFGGHFSTCCCGFGVCCHSFR